jgi:hypothetical protein
MALVKRQIRIGIELGYLATEEAGHTENMDGRGVTCVRLAGKGGRIES